MDSSCGGDVAMRRARFSGAAAGWRLFDKVMRSASSDFCPGANRYVYWLKEPIGWFVMAFGISVLVGMHVTPLGWTLASVIGSIIVVGMVWPWIAVRVVRAGLQPVVDEVHEGQVCELILSIRNAFPLPLWGLVIEGYLDREGDDVQPTTALACVPGLSQADYRLAVCPSLRGRYPVVKPLIACAFPFGIWTARRSADDCSPLTVLPQVHSIQDDGELDRGQVADWGEGQRVGTSGDRLGVREFRGGDRLRNVHWVHTARTGNLMVCERSGPEQQSVEVRVELKPVPQIDGSDPISNREAIAWRIRAAASLITHLHARRYPITMHLGSTSVATTVGPNGLRKALLALADVPADGVLDAECDLESSTSALAESRCLTHATVSDRTRMNVTSSADGCWVCVEVIHGSPIGRAAARDGRQTVALIDLQKDVACQMQRFWREVERAKLAA